MKKIIKRMLLPGLLIAGTWYINCLPEKLFCDPTSTVLLDKNSVLLGAKIASDGQWRFAPTDAVPPKFEKCLLQFEDRTFYSHYGISISGIGRALLQDLKSRRVVSGGSTLTMQLARIMRKNPPRTVTEKLVEMILATRLEIRYSKKEILDYYASNAPFGNNVVGLDAASWRYYGRPSALLSWAESATLAVLPNAPGLIYPGKNHDRLLEKRNHLLKRLYDIRVIDATTYQLALSEPLPDKPLPLPQEAPHLLDRFISEGSRGQTITSTIDHALQVKAARQLQSHSGLLRENKIYNGAVMITSVKTGEVLAYVGNTQTDDDEHSRSVDCINAPRSTGSILKPFLYAKSLEDGLITPAMLLPDIPTQFGRFAPKNFSQQFDGAVPACQALSRSLNIPMVRLLNEYGLNKFYTDLKRYGLTTLDKPAGHYGLSLILGGAEAKLCDLDAAYTQMAQEMEFGEALPLVFRKPAAGSGKDQEKGRCRLKTNRGAIFSTFEAMVEVNRPDDDGNWKTFASAQKIAWKTGTSFGFRDAWAIGITPDYVVAVWMGNASGEGRPGLTGIKAAAPLLFDLFAQLPRSAGWFRAPEDEQCSVLICTESGQRASALCRHTALVRMPKTCLSTTACPYHRLVHLSKDGKRRVDSDCESVYNMKNVSWFVLPPLIEKYYKLNHPNYKVLPDYRPECLARISDHAMAVLYPKSGSKIYIPVEIDGRSGRTIFEVAHRSSSTRIYWHLDDAYIGETVEIHQMALNPAPGPHKLTVIDENGISVTVKFEVIGK